VVARELADSRSNVVIAQRLEPLVDLDDQEAHESYRCHQHQGGRYSDRSWERSPSGPRVLGNHEREHDCGNKAHKGRPLHQVLEENGNCWIVRRIETHKAGISGNDCGRKHDPVGRELPLENPGTSHVLNVGRASYVLHATRLRQQLTGAVCAVNL